MAQKLNGAVTHVASRTEPELAWTGSRWVGADLGAAVRAAEAEGEGELQVIGSGNLVQSLHALGLVDELTLWTFPVVLGKGLHLFAEGATPRRMDLVESADLDHGMTHRRYRVAGAPGAGSVALDRTRAISRTARWVPRARRDTSRISPELAKGAEARQCFVPDGDAATHSARPGPALGRWRAHHGDVLDRISRSTTRARRSFSDCAFSHPRTDWCLCGLQSRQPARDDFGLRRL